MKKVSVEKLWGMVNRIDSKEKALIAEDFIKGCELSNEDFDELMMAITWQYRELNRCERLKPQYL